MISRVSGNEFTLYLHKTDTALALPISLPPPMAIMDALVPFRPRLFPQLGFKYVALLRKLATDYGFQVMDHQKDGIITAEVKDVALLSDTFSKTKAVGKGNGWR